MLYHCGSFEGHILATLVVFISTPGRPLHSGVKIYFLAVAPGAVSVCGGVSSGCTPFHPREFAP
jgi:hypothetical protein